MPSRQRMEGDLSVKVLMVALYVQNRYVVSDQRPGPGFCSDVWTAESRLRLAVFWESIALVINSEGFRTMVRGIERVSRRGQEVRFEILHDNERLNLDVYANGTYALRKIPRDEGGTRRTPAQEDSPHENQPQD